MILADRGARSQDGVGVAVGSDANFFMSDSVPW